MTPCIFVFGFTLGSGRVPIAWSPRETVTKNGQSDALAFMFLVHTRRTQSSDYQKRAFGRGMARPRRQRKRDTSQKREIWRDIKSRGLVKRDTYRKKTSTETWRNAEGDEKEIPARRAPSGETW